MEKLFLLDAYALIYRAYYAMIRSPRYNSKGMNTSAIFGFVNTLEDVLNKENPDYIGVAFDPKGGTFRHEVFPPYKAQREETPEDIRQAVPIIKDIIAAYRIPILEVPRYEADDVIGTLSKKADEKGVFCYMMTPDKDYAQLVTKNVNIFRPKIGDKPSEILTPESVCEKYQLTSPQQMIDLLGLMGDSSDNIPGCPGVGEKTAQKLLQEFGSIEQLIERREELKGALKEKVSNNIEKIKLSKMLATIVRDVPIELNLEELRRKEPDVARLKEIYTGLEFRSLLGKLEGETKIFPSSAREIPSPKKIIPSPKNIFPSSPDLFESANERKEQTDGKSTSAQNRTSQLDLFAETGERTLFSPSENEKNTGEGTGAANFSILSDLKSTPHDYQLVDSQEKMEHFLAIFSAEKTFAFDTETDNVNAINARLVGRGVLHPRARKRDGSEADCRKSEALARKSEDDNHRAKHQVRLHRDAQLRSRDGRAFVRHHDCALCAAARASSRDGLPGRNLPSLPNHPYRGADRGGEESAQHARLVSQRGV